MLFAYDTTLVCKEQIGDLSMKEIQDIISFELKQME